VPGLGETLRSLASFLGGDLIAPDSLRRIAATVGRLPAALTGMFGFECRLGDAASTADFCCRVTRLHGGHAVLAERSAAHALPPVWYEHPVWARLGRFCEAWAEPASALHANVCHLWLEFDVGPGTPPAVPAPSVFVGAPAASMGVDCGWMVRSAIPLLSGTPLPPPAERTLRACLEALPGGAWVRNLGLMLARPTDALRIEIKELPFDALRAFLDRVGWPGPSGEAHAALSPTALLAPTPWMMVSLDVGPSIGPRLGLECFAPMGPEWSPRWTRLLDYLVSAGLCVPAKRAALLTWCGWAHEPDGDAASPERLAPLSELVGLPARGVYVPGISHVKLSYQPGRPLEAKAYLAVELRWRLI
jgi:hypothetical protein